MANLSYWGANIEMDRAMMDHSNSDGLGSMVEYCSNSGRMESY